MKKIIILTSRGGEGLMSGSKAIQESLEEAYPGQVELTIVDFFEAFGSLGRPLTQLYNWLLRKSLLVNAIFVRLTHLLRIDTWPFLYHGIEPKFEAFLDEQKPHALIATSQYIVSYLSYYKKRHASCPHIFVGNMDLGTSCVSLWFGSHVDTHLIPTPESLAAYTRSGHSLDRALLTKPVVRAAFKRVLQCSQASLRQKLGLPSSAFLVLFAGSREGWEGVLPLVKKVCCDTSAYCVVLCGTNSSLCSTLLTLPRSRVTAVGWTDEVHAYMRACDVIVSKPGKQTVKESIAVQVPLISLCYPVVMDQEKGNLEYMRNRGVLIEGKNPAAVVEHIQRFSQDPALRRLYLSRLEAASSEIDPAYIAKLIWLSCHHRESFL